MQELLSNYLKGFCKEKISSYCSKTGREYLQSVHTDLENDLFIQLSKIYHSFVDQFLYQQAASRKMLLLLIKDNIEDKETIRQLKAETFDLLFQNEQAYIKENYPRLIELAGIREKQFFESIDEFLTRFIHDKKAIEVQLLDNRTISSFSAFETGKGDLHNHGRSTIIVHTNAGKIVYKPRDMAIDIHMKQLFDTFFANCTRLPKSIACDGYGYSEFIENRPAVTDAQAKIFFENFGQLCAIVLFLNSRDLHFENILSDGTYPIPIDLEMIISPIEKQLTTMDVPAFPERIPNWSSTILSSSMMSCILNDKIDVGVLFSTFKGNLSLPIIDGCKQTVVAYGKEFLKGFRDGYLNFCEHRNEIISFFQKLPNMNIRHLIRGTNSYGKLINKLYTLEYLKDSDVASKTLAALTDFYTNKSDTDYELILDSEVKAILEGNIPFFFVESAGTDIRDINGIVRPDILEKSCIDHVVETIQKASDVELEFEYHILEKAISRAFIFKDQTALFEKEVNTPVNSTVILQDIATQLTKKIIDDSFPVPSGDNCWFSINYKYTINSSANIISFGSNSCGIVTYLNLYAAFLKDDHTACKILSLTKNYYSVLSDLLYQFTEYPDKIPIGIVNSGLYNGLAGILHSNEVIYKLSKLDGCIEIRKYLLQLITKLDYDLDKSSISLGIAGLVKVLCTYDYYYQTDEVKSVIESLCDRLIARRKLLWENDMLWENPNSNNIVLIGYGSGQCGIASALSHAGRLLNRPDYTETADMTFSFVEKMYSKEHNGFLNHHRYGEIIMTDCSFADGAPGIGFAALQENTPTCQRILDKAIYSCMNSQLSYLDNLYEGNCAVIDFLFEAGRKLNRPELIDKAQKKMNEITTRSFANGDYTYIREKYHNFFEPGLLRGAAGVGYTLLRCLACDKVSSILI